MLTVVLQDYKNPFDIVTFHNFGPTSNDEVLTVAGKMYIDEIQGSRRANLPIKTFEEFHKVRDTLEDGYYLVKPECGHDKHLNVWKLTSAAVYGYGSSLWGPTMLKSFDEVKRLSILIVPLCKEMKEEVKLTSQKIPMPTLAAKQRVNMPAENQLQQSYFPVIAELTKHITTPGGVLLKKRAKDVIRVDANGDLIL